MTPGEAREYVKAEVLSGTYLDENGRPGRPVRLYRVVGQEERGWITESEYIRLAMVAKVRQTRQLRRENENRDEH